MASRHNNSHDSSVPITVDDGYDVAYGTVDNIIV